MKQNQLTLPYIAETQNDKDVMLSSKISGRINYILPSGSKVKKGDVIARIDNVGISGNSNSLKAQIKAQEKSLENLNTTHRRTLELLEIGGASLEQSQMEESKIAGLEAQVESLKQKLRETHNTQTYATIKSPVDGVVSKTMLNVGDMAMPGKPVARLSANTGYAMKLRVPKTLKVYGVRINNKKFEALNLNSTFNGLEEYKVYVNDESLTSGNREQIDVIIYDGVAILLPFDALLNRNGKDYVLIVNEDRATVTEVEIVESGENGVIIRNQELAGKQLVVAKQDILLKLLSGSLLTIKAS
jgi:multidrug efflux pump subunit AcrA (membrane-fusion protein)